MTPQNTSTNLGKAVRDFLQREIERIIDQEAEEAAKRVVEKIRGRTGEISSRVLEHYRMEMGHNFLRIEVDFNAKKQ